MKKTRDPKSKQSTKYARSADAPGPQKKERLPYSHQARLLINAVRPLLELFAEVDDVFTEPDAFSPDKIHKSLGRIYRKWKEVRQLLDPDFKSEKHIHPQGEKRRKIYERGLTKPNQ